VSDTLFINEIYLSLQGESTRAGVPCVFVRLTACDLRCSYCDTAFAFRAGTKRPIEDVLTDVRSLAQPYRKWFKAPLLPLIEITGGEPLLQAAVLPFMKQLCDEGYTVLLETSGAHDVSKVDERVHRIMDLKCPSSGETGRNRWENLHHLTPNDEIKFVIGTEEDYLWMRQILSRHELEQICPLLVSWVQPLTPDQAEGSLKPVPQGVTPVTRQWLAERILADQLPVRFQVQMHKVIWPANRRGV